MQPQIIAAQAFHVKWSDLLRFWMLLGQIHYGKTLWMLAACSRGI